MERRPGWSPDDAATPDRVVHMVGHSHLDPVWLWPWQEGLQEARTTFWSAIERMEDYPDFVFTWGQVMFLAWVEMSDPELFSRIRERVHDGRWQVVGGWWVEPDCNLPSGESFVRHGLYGQRYLHEKFGVTATVGLNADPFGHNVMLPQILRRQGMDSYCFMRPGPHEARLPDTAFWWESPDGSRVLTYRIPYEYGSPPGDLAGQVERALAQADGGSREVMVFYGVGNHGGGPTRANIDSIHRYDGLGTFGRMVLSSPRRYFDELLAGVGDAAQLPVWRGELQHHAVGCYSAHSGIKAWNRRAQTAVLTAERWAAVGSCWGGLRREDLTLSRAWRHVLFNQDHDILSGASVEPAYDDARDELGEAVATSKRVVALVHDVVARQVHIPHEDGTLPVLVFNPLPWPVTSTVEMHYNGQPTGIHVVDSDGRQAPSQRIRSSSTTADRGRGASLFEAAVPGLGYRLYRLRGGSAPTGSRWSRSPAGGLHATESVLENDLLRIDVDPRTGWLTGLLDKRSGVDVVAGSRGDHVQVSEDPTDTWGHHVLSYAWPGETMPVTRVVLRESGPLRARLCVERAWGRSTLLEELVLGPGDDQLEVRVTLDWREEARLLKLRFPVGLHEPTATYEVPFGTIERPVNGAEEPAQAWVDVTGTAGGPDGGHLLAGLAVIAGTKHAYDVSPGDDSPSIGMTAARSPVYAWHDPSRLDPAERYGYQDQGLQSFRYLLVPHTGDWRGAGLARRAALLEAPLRAMQEGSHVGRLPPSLSFVDDGGGPVVVAAVKMSEDGVRRSDGSTKSDLIVRAVETLGAPATARIELPVVGRVLEAQFGANQIRTFRVPTDPAGPVTETDLVEWDLPAGPEGALKAEPMASSGSGLPEPA